MTDCSISIIIPAYNVEDYICETLDSVANQTQAPDEIIIINDGSSDNTSALIRSHYLISKIKLIEIENSGQGIARNIGINEAKSEYLYFFDSDDLLVSNFIEQLKERLIIGGKPDLYLFSGKSFLDPMLKKTTFNSSYIRSFEGEYDSQQAFFEKLIKEPELSCSPCLYVSRRSLWNNNQLSFNSFYHEDEVVFYPLLFKASTYIISKDIFFLRRIRPGSTMIRKKEIKHAEGQYAVLTSLLKMLTENRANKINSRLIRRRLGIFTPSYLTTSYIAGKKIDTSLLLYSLVASRSMKASLRIAKTLALKRKIT
ncbi:glycosyltransferase family A protein [Psychrobacter celer]|uniref:glycosyltransferase family A protein n=1 Tax=Psychrobacter celer TaxID=306572 RepID=UPI003FD5458E